MKVSYPSRKIWVLNWKKKKCALFLSSTWTVEFKQPWNSIKISWLYIMDQFFECIQAKNDEYQMRISRDLNNTIVRQNFFFPQMFLIFYSWREKWYLEYSSNFLEILIWERQIRGFQSEETLGDLRRSKLSTLSIFIRNLNNDITNSKYFFNAIIVGYNHLTWKFFGIPASIADCSLFWNY